MHELDLSSIGMRTEITAGQMPVAITSFSFYTFEMFPAGVFEAVDEPDAASLVFFWLYGAAHVSYRNRFMIPTLRRCFEQHTCYTARHAMLVRVSALQRHASDGGAGC